MKRLNVYPHFQFDIEMLKNGWKDSVPANVAVISICNIDDPEDVHYFKSDDHNIINVEFNDCGENEDGCLDVSTATRLVDFIESHIGCDFYIHCNAGKSRSQGIARYILDMHPDQDYKTLVNNPCTTPNYHVVTLLKRIAYSMEIN